MLVGADSSAPNRRHSLSRGVFWFDRLVTINIRLVLSDNGKSLPDKFVGNSHNSQFSRFTVRPQAIETSLALFVTTKR